MLLSTPEALLLRYCFPLVKSHPRHVLLNFVGAESLIDLINDCLENGQDPRDFLSKLNPDKLSFLLMCAIKDNNLAAVRFLIEEVKVPADGYGAWAALSGNLEMVRYVIEEARTIDKGITPSDRLYWACLSGNESVVRYYLETDPKCPRPGLRTALLHGHYNLGMKLIQEFEANVDFEKFDVIHCLCDHLTEQNQNDAIRCARMILEKTSQPVERLVNYKNCKPFLGALRLGCLDFAKFLHSLGEMKHKNSDFERVLRKLLNKRASRHGVETNIGSCIEWLVNLEDCNEDVISRLNYSRDTFLHMACQSLPHQHHVPESQIIRIVSAIRKKCPQESLDFPNWSGEAALMKALKTLDWRARNGLPYLEQFLAYLIEHSGIEYYNDIEYNPFSLRDDGGNTPLHLLLRPKNCSWIPGVKRHVTIIVEKVGKEILSIPNNRGFIPLHKSLWNLDLFQHLIELGSITNPETALLPEAARSGCLDVVKRLISELGHSLSGEIGVQTLAKSLPHYDIAIEIGKCGSH